MVSSTGLGAKLNAVCIVQLNRAGPEYQGAQIQHFIPSLLSQFSLIVTACFGYHSFMEGGPRWGVCLIWGRSNTVFVKSRSPTPP